MWFLAALVLLQPDPRKTYVTASEHEIAKAIQRLRQGAVRRMRHYGTDQLPTPGAVTLGLCDCGWEPDAEGAMAELRRLGRDDLVAKLEKPTDEIIAELHRSGRDDVVERLDRIAATNLLDELRDETP